MKIQKCKIRSIRETVDSLTTEVITHLNKINRLLTEIEKTKYTQLSGLNKIQHTPPKIILGD